MSEVNWYNFCRCFSLSKCTINLKYVNIFFTDFWHYFVYARAQAERRRNKRLPETGHKAFRSVDHSLNSDSLRTIDKEAPQLVRLFEV